MSLQNDTIRDSKYSDDTMFCYINFREVKNMNTIVNTGDNSPLTMLIVLGVVAVAALVLVIIKRRK